MDAFNQEWAPDKVQELNDTIYQYQVQIENVLQDNMVLSQYEEIKQQVPLSKRWLKFTMSRNEKLS